MSTQSEPLLLQAAHIAHVRVVQRRYGVAFIVVAAAIWLFFSRSSMAGMQTTFLMSVNPSGANMPLWSFQTLPMINGLAAISALIGGFQLARGFGRYTALMAGLLAGVFIFAFLSWVAAGTDLNLAAMLRSTLIRSVPLGMAALSCVLCERSGVVNIAIEGMMLTAAMVAAVIGSIAIAWVGQPGNLWIGLLAGIIAGGLLAAVHAFLSIRYRADQIVSGTIINIFAVGLTSFVYTKFLSPNPALNSPGTFNTIPLAPLSNIPFIGPILFNHNIFVYSLGILMVGFYLAIFFTRWGLRLRSVGENPRAADTLGINVFRTRYVAVILGGFVAGFGGAFFSLGSAGRFSELMTAGRGFLGLAAMIFGNWHPVGAMGASMLFGFVDVLTSNLTILGMQFPTELLQTVPYIATMIVLAGIVGRGRMPAADGQPYVSET